MPRTGEKPGVGIYECKNCGLQKTLDSDDKTLPPCGRCHGVDWVKVG